MTTSRLLGHLLFLAWHGARYFPTLKDWSEGRLSGIAFVVREMIRSGIVDRRSVGRWFEYYRKAQ